jgi:hypothetical protein
MAVPLLPLRRSCSEGVDGASTLLRTSRAASHLPLPDSISGHQFAPAKSREISHAKLGHFAFRISRNWTFRISHFAKLDISHFAFRETGHFAFRISRNRTLYGFFPTKYQIVRGARHSLRVSRAGQAPALS